MFEQTFKNIDDTLWKDAGCTSELDYTEQSSWLLFLKYLDALEADKATEAVLQGKTWRPILAEPFRWTPGPRRRRPTGSGTTTSRARATTSRISSTATCSPTWRALATGPTGPTEVDPIVWTASAER